MVFSPYVKNYPSTTCHHKIILGIKGLYWIRFPVWSFYQILAMEHPKNISSRTKARTHMSGFLVPLLFWNMANHPLCSRFYGCPTQTPFTGPMPPSSKTIECCCWQLTAIPFTQELPSAELSFLEMPMRAMPLPSPPWAGHRQWLTDVMASELPVGSSSE